MTAIDTSPNRCACGAEIGRWSVRCDECRVKALVAAATVVEPSGPLNVVDSETFYFDLTEAAEYSPGAYAHPCDEIPLHVHAKRVAADLVERVVEDMCEEAHEDAPNQVQGEEALRQAIEAALETFNTAQTSCSWMPRVKEVFVIPASADTLPPVGTVTLDTDPKTGNHRVAA